MAGWMQIRGRNRGHPWYSSNALDCWPTGQWIDPAPRAWFITNSSHSPRLFSASIALTVQNRGLKHHSFINISSYICLTWLKAKTFMRMFLMGIVAWNQGLQRKYMPWFSYQNMLDKSLQWILLHAITRRGTMILWLQPRSTFCFPLTITGNNVVWGNNHPVSYPRAESKATGDRRNSSLTLLCGVRGYTGSIHSHVKVYNIVWTQSYETIS